MPHPPPVRSDIPRIVLAVLVLGMLIAASFWILKPFLPALIWATMIVVATWPLMKRVEALLFGRRSLAVVVMTVAFLLLVATPIAYGVTAIVEYLPALVGRFKEIGSLGIPPPPFWLAHLPMVGERLAADWQQAATGGAGVLVERIAPYTKVIGTWLVAEAGGLGLFAVQLLLTLVLTAILYASGETAARGVERFAMRLAGERGERAVELAGQSIRAVALGIIVTALVQSTLAGIGLGVTGVPYAVAITALIFVACVAQIGPLVVLLPAVAWLYWKDANTAATVLLIWSIAVGTLDNLLRPILIRRGADLPLMLILAGVLGGLFAFGVVGLFVGPVVLAVSYRLLEAWIDEGLGGRPLRRSDRGGGGDGEPAARSRTIPPERGDGFVRHGPDERKAIETQRRSST